MNIGLVLSGGMAKGAYQIGALKALNEFIPQKDIKYMSCASIGVLNGYAYATENLNHAGKMWKNICTNDTRLVISQILRSSMLQHNIVKLYDGNKKLSATFYASLFDLNNRNIVYKDLYTVDKSSIPLYLKASVAMPVYNRAVKISNISYFDGAMIDNIPVFPLLKYNLDYIVCIYFDDTRYKFENTYFDNKIIKITFPSENRFKQSLIFKQNEIEEMMKTGYERALHLLQYIFTEGYDNLEYIYHAINFLNQNKSNSLRISGDVIVTNLNKITQKLTKRKIL